MQQKMADNSNFERSEEDDDILLATLNRWMRYQPMTAVVLVSATALAGGGGKIGAKRLLLDNQSSVNLHSNYSGVSNLRKADRSIKITTAAGSVVCTQVATCNCTNLWVWMHPVPGNLNIILYSQVDEMGLTPTGARSTDVFTWDPATEQH